MIWIQIMRKMYTLLLFVFETGSCYAAQASPELTILLSQPSTQTPDVRYHVWSDFTNFLKVVSKKLFKRKAESLPVQRTFQKPAFSWFYFLIAQKGLVRHYHKSHLKSTTTTTTTVFGILDWVCHESCNLSDTTFVRGTMMFKKTKPGLAEMLRNLTININYI